MTGVLGYGGPQTTPKKAITEQGLPFLKEDQFTDTVLVVEGRKMYLNRSMLGYASPVFQKMLDSAHKTALSEKKAKAEIKISDKNFPDFVDMLAFLHPGVCRELTEKMALRLLPLTHEYDMAALKERCERVLVSALKKTKLDDVHGPPSQRNRRDNTPEILLKCTKAADKGMSQTVLTQCLKMFANPAMPLKDLKSSPDISSETKSKIFESRMDNAAHKLNRVANELDREKYEKELLKKQLSEKYVLQHRTAFGSAPPDKKKIHQKSTAFGSSLPDKSASKSIEYVNNNIDPVNHTFHKTAHMRYAERKQIHRMVNAMNTPRR